MRFGSGLGCLQRGKSFFPKFETDSVDGFFTVKAPSRMRPDRLQADATLGGLRHTMGYAFPYRIQEPLFILYMLYFKLHIVLSYNLTKTHLPP